MPAQPSQIDLFDPAVLSQLACPACLGGLRPEGARLVCAGCGRVYPVVDGIPVLIAERAEILRNG
ncbi:MAG: Trm112 family protein [Terracidiphilus sp.]|nr:Trm112 family protein [Terracidiphilus sp.]